MHFLRSICSQHPYYHAMASIGVKRYQPSFMGQPSSRPPPSSYSTFMSNNSFSAQAIMTSFCFPSATYATEKFWLCGGLISPLLIGPQITNYVGDTSMSSQLGNNSWGWSF